MSQSVNIASAIPDSYRLSSCLLHVARLPSAATYDWTTQAASSFAPLLPPRTDARIGVVIAKIDHDSARFIPESTGVSLTDLTGSEDDPHFQAECSRARSPLDRIGSAGFTLSENHLQTGFVTNTQSLLPHWYASPLTSPWNTGQSLIACAPLHTLSQDHSTAAAHSRPTHALLVLIGTDVQTDLIINPLTIGAALRMLTHQARNIVRCHTDGSILWLTQREQHILDQLITGDSVRAIAESIGRSPHTVHDHVKNLHRKLDATSRGQLIANALGFHDQSTTPPLINPEIDPVLTKQFQDQQQFSNTPQALSEIKPTAQPTEQHNDLQTTKAQATPLNRL